MATRRKAVRRSNEWYRAALLGVSDSTGELSPGLRSVARGFDPKDGFDLHALARGEWTRGQKAKVRRYFHELQELTGQEKIIVRTRSAKKLRAAQVLGGHKAEFDFKVAFLPGSKDAKIEWQGDEIVIREHGYQKIESAFDPEMLAHDVEFEIGRVLTGPKMKRANRFRVQAGANLIGELNDADKIEEKVRRLMWQYDGRRALPQGSGNLGDRPDAHHWSKWLFGITGYVLPKRGRAVDETKAWEELDRNKEMQRLKYNARKREYNRRRKGHP